MQFAPQSPDETALLADALRVAAREYRKKVVDLLQAGDATAEDVRAQAATLTSWQASLSSMPPALLPQSPTES